MVEKISAGTGKEKTDILKAKLEKVFHAGLVHEFHGRSEDLSYYFQFILVAWRLANPHKELKNCSADQLLEMASVDLATAVDINSPLLPEVIERETILGFPEIPDESQTDEPDIDDGLGWLLYTTTQHRLLTPAEEIMLSWLTKLGKVAAEIETRGWTSQGLRQAVVDGAAAGQDLILYNQRLVVDMAVKKSGLPFDPDMVRDLALAGNEGLEDAVKGFDPERGRRFSTYASWWIYNYVRREKVLLEYEIKLPISMYEAMGKILRAKKKLIEEKKELTTEALAAESGKSVETVAVLLEYWEQGRWPRSVEEMFEEDSDQDQFPQSFEAPETEVMTAQREDTVEVALKTLPPREEQVLRWRFGFETLRPLTLEECGQRMGVSKERARQIEATALDRLRRPTQRRILKQI